MRNLAKIRMSRVINLGGNLVISKQWPTFPMFLRKHFGMFVRHLMGMPFENLVQKKKSFDVLDHVESFDLSMFSCNLKTLLKNGSKCGLCF